MRIPAVAALFSAPPLSPPRKPQRVGLRRQARRTGLGKLDPAWKVCPRARAVAIDIRDAPPQQDLQPSSSITSPALSPSKTTATPSWSTSIRAATSSPEASAMTSSSSISPPSEEAVKGKLTDMVVHMVHKSADGKQP